jgi:thiol-disulfide isomerase/thioredoxin
VAVDGRFACRIPLDTFSYVSVWRKNDLFFTTAPVSKTLDFLLAPQDRVRIRGKAESRYVAYDVKGSSLNAEIAEYRKQNRSLSLTADSLQALNLDALRRRADREELQRIGREREENGEKERNADRLFIREHPGSEWSAFLLLNQDPDTVLAYLPLLSESVRAGRFQSQLEQKTAMKRARLLWEENIKREYTGNPAPDFTLTGIDGKPFTLSEFDSQGKYIVLDFWGSWCAPCIDGFPEMKRYYEKYRPQVEFIGIACQDWDVRWRDAIEKNGLNWIQLFDDNTLPEKKLDIVYGIEIFPTKIILSSDKSVLAVFKGEDTDFYEKLDELLK